MRRPFHQLPFAELPDAPRLAHPYFGTPFQTVPVDSAHFGPMNAHVRVAGQGPPLLLVHGFMTSSYSWRYVIEALSARFTIYMPDLPGAGRSDKPDVSYSPAHIATWIGELMDALGIAGCPVIGNSLGGYLTMRLALQRPDVMSRLLNLHSPGLVTPRIVALRYAMALPFSFGLVRKLVHFHPERWVQKNVHYYDETLKSREETREYSAPLSTPEGIRSFARMLKETMAPHDMRDFERQLVERQERGEGFVVPLMLMYADKDPMVPPAVGERLRRLLPDAEWVQLQSASHFAHVDNPAAFLEPAIRFVEAA